MAWVYSVIQLTFAIHPGWEITHTCGYCFVTHAFYEVMLWNSMTCQWRIGRLCQWRIATSAHQNWCVWMNKHKIKSKQTTRLYKTLNTLWVCAHPYTHCRSVVCHASWVWRHPCLQRSEICPLCTHAFWRAGIESFPCMLALSAVILLWSFTGTALCSCCFADQFWCTFQVICCLQLTWGYSVLFYYYYYLFYLLVIRERYSKVRFWNQDPWH